MRRACSLGVASLLLVAGAGCSRTAATPDSPAATTNAPAAAAGSESPSAPASGDVQLLKLTYASPTVGSDVRASAAGLPAGKTVDLVWQTVEGGWVIEDYYHFRGKKYAESTLSLGTFTVDANGALDARFTIPEDFGGVHDIVASIDGKTVAQNGIDVKQSFSMSPASGPIGTPIELKVNGLGWRTMESTWVVNWDNNLVGFVSAASSRGSAVARFRAAGPSGDHIVKLLTGWQGQGYLNHEQSPVAHLPRPEFRFRTTPGAAALPAIYAEPYPKQPIPKTELQITNANLTLTPAQAPVGTKASLRGDGFPAGTSLELLWETYVGNRVSTEGFEPAQTAIGPVKVDARGRIDAPVTIPDDLGGLHALMLRDGDKTLARVYFVTETSIVSMTPMSGPVGTDVTIHLKGVGWTEYDNIYIATYDNAYMGYACGFNSQGDVVINFRATGAPGLHVIDLYPGIYQGPATEPQQLYRQPQLTYADDHPGNKIPALRFMFEVTAGGARPVNDTR
jgi:hypothetical protein